MALVVETGSGRNPAAASYCSVEFANAYHETGTNAEAWAFVDPPDRERALVTASRLLDASVEWRGRPLYVDQPLGWPRRGVVGPDHRAFPAAAVPNAVRLATALLALKVATDAVAALEAQAAGTATVAGTADTTQQVQEITLGPIGIKLAAASAEAIQAQAEVAAKSSRAVPVEVAAILRPWGDYVGSGAALGRVTRG